MLTDKQKINRLEMIIDSLIDTLKENEDIYYFMIERDDFEYIKRDYEHYEKEKKIGLNNDNTRDIAIRCVDEMFEHNLLDTKYYLLDDEFKIQDIIHNEINKALKIKEDA